MYDTHASSYLLHYDRKMRIDVQTEANGETVAKAHDGTNRDSLC